MKNTLLKCISTILAVAVIASLTGCDGTKQDKRDTPTAAITDSELEKAGTWTYSFFDGLKEYTEYYDPDGGLFEAIDIETFSFSGTPFMVMSFDPMSSRDNSRLFLFNMADPVSPRMVSTIAHDNGDGIKCLVRDMAIQDSVIYCGLFGDRGLWAVDISDPLQPVDLGISPVEADDNIVISGTYLYSSGQLYNGIIVCDISDPSNVSEIRKIDIATRDCVLAAGNNVLLLGIEDTLTVYDISSPDNPEHRADLVLPLSSGLSTEVTWDGHIMNWSSWGHINDIAISGDRAYLAFGAGNIRVIDISDPAEPKEIKELETPGFAVSVHAEEATLYVSTADYETKAMSLSVLDISEPDEPRIVDSIGTDIDFVLGGLTFAYCWMAPRPVDDLIMVPGMFLINFFRFSRTPEAVLAELPVYPGAEETDEDTTGFVPFSTPASPEFEGRPPDIEYATASAHYTVKESAEKILEWYEKKLASQGYTKYTSMNYNGPDGCEVRSIGFLDPVNSLISVEIHAYDATNGAVFAVITSKDMTTDPDPAPPIPNDIKMIEITVYDDEENIIATETVENTADIGKISDIINALPVLPDAPIMPDIHEFDMTFFSKTEGKITLGCDTIHTGGYMVRIWEKLSLSDGKGELLDAVKTILGIKD